MKSEMRSESDGESEVEGKIITCQRQDCEVKRVNYEDVSARFNLQGANFCDFSFSAKESIFAVEYARSNTGKMRFIASIIDFEASWRQPSNF